MTGLLEFDIASRISPLHLIQHDAGPDADRLERCGTKCCSLQPKLSRSPDTHLAVPELNSLTLKLETGFEVIAGHDSTAFTPQFFEAAEGGEP